MIKPSPVLSDMRWGELKLAQVAGICNPSFLYYKDLQSAKFRFYIKIVIFASINIFCSGKCFGLKLLLTVVTVGSQIPVPCPHPANFQIIGIKIIIKCLSFERNISVSFVTVVISYIAHQKFGKINKIKQHNKQLQLLAEMNFFVLNNLIILFYFSWSQKNEGKECDSADLEFSNKRKNN